MPFEEGSADVLVKGQGLIFVQDWNTLGYVLWLCWVSNWGSKESLEPLERVLIHRINDIQVNDTEEEEGGAVSDLSERFSSDINFLLSDLRLGFSDSDFISSDLWIGQNINKVVVS